MDPLEHRPEGAAAPDLGAVGGAMGFEAMDGGENQRNMVIYRILTKTNGDLMQFNQEKSGFQVFKQQEHGISACFFPRMLIDEHGIFF